MAMWKTRARRAAYEREAASARVALASGRLDEAFGLLERAHILGQPWFGAHSWTHWMMLQIGWRRRDAREVVGQLLRLSTGGLLSLFGWLPHGNTGGADVPPKRPMPIPEDLRAYCEAPRAG